MHVPIGAVPEEGGRSLPSPARIAIGHQEEIDALRLRPCPHVRERHGHIEDRLQCMEAFGDLLPAGAEEIGVLVGDGVRQSATGKIQDYGIYIFGGVMLLAAIYLYAF